MSAPRRTIVNTLAAGLRTDGLVTVLDRLWLLAAASTQQANIDLISLGTWSTVGAITFIGADLGYTTGGAGSLETNYNTSTAGESFVQNSASFGGYVLNARSPGGTESIMGVSGGGVVNQLLPYLGGDGAYEINGSTFPTATGTTNNQGFWVVSRTSSSAVALYRNGNSTPIGSSAGDTSGAPPNATFNVFRTNGTGHDSNGTNMAAAFIGGGLNATQATNLSNRVNAYMTSLSINVY